MQYPSTIHGSCGGLANPWRRCACSAAHFANPAGGAQLVASRWDSSLPMTIGSSVLRSDFWLSSAGTRSPHRPATHTSHTHLYTCTQGHKGGPHATRLLQPCQLGQCHTHPLPRLGLFAPGRAGGEHLAPRLWPHRYPVRDRVTLQLLQRSTLFIVQRQIQMITLLISAQPSLAGRPRRSRYRATRSLIVATKALSSWDVWGH